MSENHTPERRQDERRKGTIWERGSRFLILGKPVECVDCSVLDRIVACVNACTGLNPEAIPDIVDGLKQTKAIIDDVWQYLDFSKPTAFHATTEKGRLEAARSLLAQQSINAGCILAAAGLNPEAMPEVIDCLKELVEIIDNGDIDSFTTQPARTALAAAKKVEGT